MDTRDTLPSSVLTIKKHNNKINGKWQLLFDTGTKGNNVRRPTPTWTQKQVWSSKTMALTSQQCLLHGNRDPRAPHLSGVWDAAFYVDSERLLNVSNQLNSKSKQKKHPLAQLCARKKKKTVRRLHLMWSVRDSLPVRDFHCRITVVLPFDLLKIFLKKYEL